MRNKKFGRDSSSRRAMFRNLVGNLVLHERIETSDTKAKELRQIAERMVTKALRLGDELTVDVAKIKGQAERNGVIARRLHALRDVASFLPKKMASVDQDGNVKNVDLVHKLFNEIAPRYLERVKANKGGGYTRIIKVNRRRGDNAPMSLIEFIGSEDVRPVKEKTPPTQEHDHDHDHDHAEAPKGDDAPKEKKAKSSKKKKAA
jgi:large subunit ribosomal protein L17